MPTAELKIENFKRLFEQSQLKSTLSDEDINAINIAIEQENIPLLTKIMDTLQESIQTEKNIASNFFKEEKTILDEYKTEVKQIATEYKQEQKQNIINLVHEQELAEKSQEERELEDLLKSLNN